MKAYLNGKPLYEVSDHLSASDTIIDSTKTYIVESKTFDADKNELYCKIKEIKNELSVTDILKDIYKSEYLETSGGNTSGITNNPKTIILMTLAGLIIEPKYFSKNNKLYMANISAYWNDRKIHWKTIFDNDPPVNISDISAIKQMAAKLLTDLKINKNLWPNLD